MTPEREKYFASTIAFDCPQDGKRRTIDDCFKKCQCSDYFYRKWKGVLYCALNQRELLTGDHR
jgi:hypothetical protein